MTSFQIGAQMFSVRDRCQDAGSMLSAMQALYEAGYRNVQFSGHNKEITAAQLRDMLDKTGMQCSATHISFQEMEEDLDKVIADHKLIGCAYPGIGGLPKEYRGSPEGFLEFARRATAVADKLADAGLHFIYHNHAFEFTRFAENKKTGLEMLFEHCGKNVQFELDVFWVQRGGGNPLEWIRKAKGRMDVVHFKEMNGTLDNNAVIAPIGTGNLDWKAIMAACEEIGVKYAYIEQDNAVETDSIACMKVSHDYLAGLGGRF